MTTSSNSPNTRRVNMNMPDVLMHDIDHAIAETGIGTLTEFFKYSANILLALGKAGVTDSVTIIQEDKEKTFILPFSFPPDFPQSLEAARADYS